MAEEHHEEHGGGGGHGGGGHDAGGHGGGGHEEGHEGAPEWLISFADNVALMMGFFVVLLAMNMKPATAAGSGGGATEINGISVDMLDWALSVREAFNNPVSVSSTDPSEAEMVTRLRQQRGLEPDAPPGGGRGEKTVGKDPGVPGKYDKSETVRPSDYHGLGGVVLFDRGSSRLDDESRAQLEKIAIHIRGLNTMVDLRAHCSAAEVYNATDAGMQLAFTRAQVTGRALADLGIEWKRLRLTAVGNNERVVEHEYDEPSKREQQRVEIICTNESASP